MTRPPAAPFPLISAQRQDLATIIRAAVTAVLPERLITEQLTLSPPRDLLLCAGQPIAFRGDPLDLGRVNRIVVVGAGKAAAGFAAGLEHLLGPTRLATHRVEGVVSVPAGCGRQLRQIEVRETRPPGFNLPTAAVLAATEAMLDKLSGLGPDDLAVVLITGGGSALLEAPIESISLETITRLTGHLATNGADISDINTIRRVLSRVKGGGLAAACTTGRMLAVVLSDVIGDDLATIASGPCLPSATDVAVIADLLHRYEVSRNDCDRVLRGIRHATSLQQGKPPAAQGDWTTPSGCRVQHLLLGSNATAVAAAATAAAACGYEVTSASTVTGAEHANDTGRRLARTSRDLVARCQREGRPLAFIEGGEATVVVPADHGQGGRNQQTVLAAVHDALTGGKNGWPNGLLLASFGTDGEDGPTTAAGALSDQSVAAALASQPAALAQAIDRCDASPLLAATNGLIQTGPTGTNVADVRIILAQPTDSPDRRGQYALQCGPLQHTLRSPPEQPHS